MAKNIFSDLKIEFQEKFSDPKFTQNFDLNELENAFGALIYKSRIDDQKNNWKEIDFIFKNIKTSISIYKKLLREKNHINATELIMSEKYAKYDIYLYILLFIFSLACFSNIFFENLIILFALIIILFFTHNKINISNFETQTTSLNAIYDFEINRLTNDVAVYGFSDMLLTQFNEYENNIFNSSLSSIDLEKCELILKIKEAVLKFEILEKIDPNNKITESIIFKKLLQLSFEYI